jgi:DNA-directed RNA polymerase subunit N (RpoN/RPB10)
VVLYYTHQEAGMNFFKNLFSPPRPAGKFHTFAVKCNRCGEIIHGQVNVNNEPSLEIDEHGKTFYSCRKVLIGNQHCFERIEVIFKFDESRRILDKEISGGEFVEE